MPLAPGSKVGVYRVLAPLGSGGMGEVYRARDSALGREVALKTLPEGFASHPDRLAMFAREAKVLASLNHPNIAAIHGLESSGQTPVLVLELVAGQTLAERIESGPLPLDEALEIARQMAAALEAAHEQNVVHRDLKPGNVKVTPDGQVKVLDFGLAKALNPELDQGTSWSSASQSPTWTHQTALGTVVGTAGYMSPEQARGRAVDKRADVWGFGVVLYELLTGRYAFRREDATETLAAVLRDDVDWGALPAETPPLVRRLLRRCLERDPRRRLRDIGDARLDLEEALAGAGAEAAAPGVPAGAPRPLGVVLLAAAAAGALVAGAAAWVLLRSPAETPPPLRVFEIAPPAGHTLHDLAVSSDGRAVAFTATRAGERRLFLRALDQLEVRVLDGTEGARQPFFSPDGEWLAYATGWSETGDAKLERIPIAGGSPTTICSGEWRGASWGKDGTIWLGSTRGLFAVAASGGVPRRVTDPPEGESHYAPQSIPGTGRGLVYQVSTGSTPDARIELLDLGSGERTRLAGGTGPLVARSGHLVFGRADALWAARFDARRGRVLGDAVRVIDRADNSFRGEATYAVTAAGDLVYKTADDNTAGDTAVLVDRGGVRTALALPDHDVTYPRFSPDGTRIGYGGSRGDDEDVWLFDLARSMSMRFTHHPAQDLDHVWTPDGRQILFHSHRDGPGNMYRQAANGTGSVERLTTVAAEQVPNGVSPDGRYLLLTVETAGAGFDLHLLALDRGGEAVPLFCTTANEAAAEFSRDGRYIAYVSDESGRAEVYVRPFPDVDGDRWQVSSGGGQSPLFSRDGRELFFATEGTLKRVLIDTTEGFRAGPVETVLAGPFVIGAADERKYDASPDGRTFVVLEPRAPESGPGARVRVVLGWARELAQTSGGQ